MFFDESGSEREIEMPSKNRKSPLGSKDVFRPGGSFMYQGKSVTILLNAKNGQAAFEIDGKRVEDPQEQDALAEYFQSVNRLSK